MMEFFKAISSGTTALVHTGPPPRASTIAAALDPVRGIGADLFVAAGDQLRVFTPSGEISPPSAAIRIAAAHLHMQAPNAKEWEIHAPGQGIHVTWQAGEYAINHGPWQIVGGPKRPDEGSNVVVHFSGLEGPRLGLQVACGGHTTAVAAVGDPVELGKITFHPSPRTEPQTSFVGAAAVMGQRTVDLTDPDGTVLGSQPIGALQARGHDPDLGEVVSCDVLAIASAAAAHRWAGEGGAREWVVVFGGGNTRVNLGDHAVASARAELFASISWTPPQDE